MDLVSTGHANEQMRSRDITWAQVVETVEKFEVTYDSRGDQCFQRGDVAVVTTRPASDGVRVVKTVLLRQVEQWSNDDARARARRPVVRQSSPLPRPTSRPSSVQVPALVSVPAPKPVPRPRPAKHKQ